jgi:hypothetical protein
MTTRTFYGSFPTCVTPKRCFHQRPARPITPLYSFIGEILRVHFSRALTRQETPRKPWSGARRRSPGRSGASAVRGKCSETHRPAYPGGPLGLSAAGSGPAGHRPGGPVSLWATPCGFPVQQKIIKLPWIAQGWVGLANYRELLARSPFLAGPGQHVMFTVVSVALELVLGLLAASGHPPGPNPHRSHPGRDSPPLGHSHGGGRGDVVVSGQSRLRPHPHGPGDPGAPGSLPGAPGPPG